MACSLATWTQDRCYWFDNFLSDCRWAMYIVSVIHLSSYWWFFVVHHISNVSNDISLFRVFFCVESLVPLFRFSFRTIIFALLDECFFQWNTYTHTKPASVCTYTPYSLETDTPKIDIFGCHTIIHCIERLLTYYACINWIDNNYIVVNGIDKNDHS